MLIRRIYKVIPCMREWSDPNWSNRPSCIWQGYLKSTSALIPDLLKQDYA